MEAIFSLVVGLFFAASIYLMLSSHLVRILLGVSIFGNAVNLMIFTAGRLGGPAPPVRSASSRCRRVFAMSSRSAGRSSPPPTSGATRT